MSSGVIQDGAPGGTTVLFCLRLPMLLFQIAGASMAPGIRFTEWTPHAIAGWEVSSGLCKPTTVNTAAALIQ